MLGAPTGVPTSDGITRSCSRHRSPAFSRARLWRALCSASRATIPPSSATARMLLGVLVRSWRVILPATHTPVWRTSRMPRPRSMSCHRNPSSSARRRPVPRARCHSGWYTSSRAWSRNRATSASLSAVPRRGTARGTSQSLAWLCPRRRCLTASSSAWHSRRWISSPVRAPTSRPLYQFWICSAVSFRSGTCAIGEGSKCTRRVSAYPLRVGAARPDPCDSSQVFSASATLALPGSAAVPVSCCVSHSRRARLASASRL